MHGIPLDLYSLRDIKSLGLFDGTIKVLLTPYKTARKKKRSQPHDAYGSAGYSYRN